MYKCILVATGGSPWSHAAVSYAIALAVRTDAVLYILTVLTNPGSYATPDILGATDIVVDLIERQGQGLLAQAADEAAAAGVTYEALSRWGSVPETIIQIATEEQCELIVLGSRTVYGWKRLQLGRYANAVASKAQQPVLIVKRPPLPMQQYGDLWHRVLVATGGSPWSDIAVEHALALARAHDFEVVLLHVMPERRRFRGADPGSDEGTTILALAEARAEAMGVSYTSILTQGPVSTKIVDVAAQQDCDSIILGSRGLGGWKRLMLGSISNAVAAKASLPVLVVKRFLLR
jgi:nucleotide-binding universal stress UspA family protein